MPDRLKNFNSGRSNFYLLGFIALIMAGAVLKITAPVLLPFTIAVLLSFVLEPLVSALEKIRVPRIIGILLSIFFIGACLYLIGVILFSSGRTILTLYPKYERRFSEIYSRIALVFSLPYDEHLTFFQNLWGQLGLRVRVQGLAFQLSEAFLGFLKDAVMVLLFTAFLLLEISHFRDKIQLAFEDKLSGRIKKAASDVVNQVARYLSVKFFISLTTGILVTIGLSLLKMDFPIVWGVVSFILNFIPNIGSVAAGAGVGVFALVQFWPDPAPIAGSLAVMVGVNMVLGNVLEPKVQGDNLGLSPFVILVSMLAWSWLWGFAGLVLAVPMTVIVKIVCENVPMLEPASIILGSFRAAVRKKTGDPEHAVPVPPVDPPEPSQSS